MQRRRGGAADPARPAGDRDHLSVQRSQSLCHFPVPPVDVTPARYRARDWLTSQSTTEGILNGWRSSATKGTSSPTRFTARDPGRPILMPGLLLSQKMQTPLATDLAGHGNRVVTFDFLGHGDSDRPQEMGRYSMPEFARQTVALLDHLSSSRPWWAGRRSAPTSPWRWLRWPPERVRGHDHRDARARQGDPGRAPPRSRRSCSR